MSVDRDGWNRLWPVPLCQRTDHWYANMLLPMFFPVDDGNFPEKVCPDGVQYHSPCCSILGQNDVMIY